jgi:DNA-binding CsgD family transcriptional regulator
VRHDERLWHDVVLDMLTQHLRATIVHTIRLAGEFQHSTPADDWLRSEGRRTLGNRDESNPHLALFLSPRAAKTWIVRLPLLTVRHCSTPLGDIAGILYHLPRSNAVRCTVIAQATESSPWTHGDRFLIRLISHRLYLRYAHGYFDPTGDVVSTLSQRQRDTLNHLLDGLNEPEIAKKMCVSTHTVHTYIKTLYRHFDVTSRAQLLSPFIERLPVHTEPLVRHNGHNHRPEAKSPPQRSGGMRAVRP